MPNIAYILSKTQQGTLTCNSQNVLQTPFKSTDYHCFLVSGLLLAAEVPPEPRPVFVEMTATDHCRLCEQEWSHSDFPYRNTCSHELTYLHSISPNPQSFPLATVHTVIGVAMYIEL